MSLYIIQQVYLGLFFLAGTCIFSHGKLAVEVTTIVHKFYGGETAALHKLVTCAGTSAEVLQNFPPHFARCTGVCSCMYWSYQGVHRCVYTGLIPTFQSFHLYTAYGMCVLPGYTECGILSNFEHFHKSSRTNFLFHKHQVASLPNPNYSLS